MSSGWVMVAVPLLFGTAYALSGIREGMPELYTIMILQMAITPITSSVAFAALMGLDVAFSLAALIVSNALSPITTVAFSYMFLGTSLFSPIELGIKLFFFFAGAGAIAFAIRRAASQKWIERQKEHIDGLNVIAVFIFIFLVFRYVSIASILSVALFPLLAWILEPCINSRMVGVMTAASLIIIARHHENIRRLLNHTESRFQWRRT